MAVKTTTLANGITVLSQDYTHLETVALGIWTKTGARDERLEQNGIAHMLEHMAFKGTPTRSARAIAEEIEAVGGDLNAATSMETTSYTARMLKQDWPMALNVLADIVSNPLFEPHELERERGVVLQEIAAANDTPDDLVYDLGHAAAFPDQAVGRAILGTSERIAAFTPDHLHAFRNDHYTAAKMVISAVGRIDHDALVEQVSGHFESFPTAEVEPRPQAVFTGGSKLLEKPLDQTHVLLSFPTIGYRHRDIYALQILSVILGGGMSSKLFQKVREEHGLCYAIYAHVSAFEDIGLFSVYAATGPELAGKLIDVSSDTILSLAADITSADLERARRQIRAGLVMSLESAAGRADQIARQYMARGKVTEIKEIVAKIEAVGLADVRRLAETVFNCDRPSFSCVGALTHLPTFENMARRFS